MITYHDISKDYGAVNVFSPFEELNNIVAKVDALSKNNISDIVSNRGQYRYSDKIYDEHPEEMKKTADRRIAPSAFDRMPNLFTSDKPSDGYEYVQIYGNDGNDRVFRWFRKDYLVPIENLDKYKVFISKADGAAGQIGSPIPARICGKPVVMGPNIGSTETYISIGSVNSEFEANSIAKYVKTKFARVMLGVLKVTQNNAKPVWSKIPLQNFTDNSDIDWTKTISDIDKQLYLKYHLSLDEIQFIESHVQEMNRCPLLRR